MAQVTDAELREEIEKILNNADLSKTSTSKVIKKLEEVFDTELTSKKDVIDKMVLDYVNSQASDDDEEDEEEEEEEKKPPPKRAAKTTKRAKKSRKNESSDDDDDDNDSEYEEKKPKAKAKKAGGKKRGGTGYTRLCKLTPELADLMGEERMARHDVVKRMWGIIKEKKLHDPANKQFAICDEALYKVIGTKRFRIFGMMKYLKSHFMDD